ncbi:MAG TPA: hypothetical protein VIT23_12010 [Terrimicrobiaceae bacterium]
MDCRVVRTRNPARVIVAAVLIGLFVAGFIVLAIWQSGMAIERARMAGKIVAKEFVPKPEHQITLNRKSGLRSVESEGDYILTVEVVASDGTKKSYHVWLDKKRYNAAKIGGVFDVGPYLVKDKK